MSPTSLHWLLVRYRLAIVDGAGHLSPLEQPDRTASELAASLTVDP